MKKVMLVFGTRPEAIKICSLVNELKKRESIQTVVYVTGQHCQRSHAGNPYGDGHACERIANILESKKYSPWVLV